MAAGDLLNRLILVAAVPVLTACGITGGTVTAKSYAPAHDETVVMTIGGCTCYPETDHIPECWRIDFAKDDDTNDVCVSKVDWDRFQIGQRIETAEPDGSSP